MSKIYKYELEITDKQILYIPKGGKILSVQFQNSTLCLWALVDLNNPNQERIIRILGTGHEAKESSLKYYIDTVQQFDGKLIWHVFEEGNTVE